jgi:putative AdoMet-dependent methyltransferase
MSERVRLFDDWAAGYDESVRDCRGFPFEGYDEVLGTIARLAAARAGATVLDLGIGTGKLAERLVAVGAAVCGLDFSASMLAKARARLPNIELAKADLLGGWPLEPNRRFDRIVSSYVLHEFDLGSKVRLLARLTERHLAPGGWMVIGDTSFATVRDREAAHEEHRDRWDMEENAWKGGLWDEDEHYWAADESIRALAEQGLRVEYRQVSSCGGVYVMEPREVQS